MIYRVKILYFHNTIYIYTIEKSFIHRTQRNIDLDYHLNIEEI